MEVVVAGDLAAEHRPGVAHARLEERMPDTVDQRGAARRGDGLGHGAARAHVVEDRRARLLAHQRLAEQRGEEVAVDEAAGVVDEEAAVGVAVPGDPEVGALRAHLLDDEAAVLPPPRAPPAAWAPARGASPRGHAAAATSVQPPAGHPAPQPLSP